MARAPEYSAFASGCHLCKNLFDERIIPGVPDGPRDAGPLGSLVLQNLRRSTNTDLPGGPVENTGFGRG